MNKQRTRNKHTLRNILILLAVLIAAGIWIIPRTLKSARASALLSNKNDFYTVQTGEIRNSVFGSGPVTATDHVNVKTQLSGEILEIAVEKGAIVTAGETLAVLDDTILQKEIDNLQQAVDAQEKSLLSQRVMQSNLLLAPLPGRVILINAQKDDDVTGVMATHGALALLSIDGRMKLTVDKELTAGTPVTVTVDKQSEKGYVAFSADGQSVIIVESDTLPYGSLAQVTSEQEVLGEGKLALSSFYEIQAKSGVIASVKIKEGAWVEQGDVLFTFANQEYPKNYIEQLEALDDLRADLAETQAKRELLLVKSPIDGIVADISAYVGMTAGNGTTLFVISDTQRMQLAIEVDEVDMKHIAVGQSATLRFDAYPDEVYTAQVERISRVGNIINDVTSYPVYVSFDGDAKLFEGMHASADITAASKQDVLLVPLEAVRSGNGEKYVQLFVSDTEARDVTVTLGIVNETTAEITEGLTAGDVVLVSKTDDNNNPFGMFGTMRGNR